MRESKIPKELGGGMRYDFEQEELEEILVEHLVREGKDIPREETEPGFEHHDGEGGTLHITRRGSNRSHRSDPDDIPF
jgi:hypothetical protein